MSDLSGLTPLPKNKGHSHPAGEPSTFYTIRNGRMLPIGADGEPEWPYGRVHLPGGGRAISEYGRSYPLPETLTELRLAKGVRLPIRQTSRLRANPTNNLEGWFQRNWKGVVAGVAGLVLLAIAAR